MRNLTLIKSHPNVQLGHLYEHIFVGQVDKYFYSHNLYESLDYISHGATYEQTGVITIDINFYSDGAWSHRDQIMQLPLRLGKDNINVTNALRQIEAEEPERLFITDKKQVIDELNELGAQDWLSADDYTSSSAKGVRRRYEPIYLTDRKQKKRRAIKTTLSLDASFLSDNRELAPLFNTVGRFILRNTDNQATAHYGYYSGELSGAAKPLSVSSEMWNIPDADRSVDIADILRVSQDTIARIMDSSTIERLATELQGASYSGSPEKAPDIRRLLAETGALIGSNGWRDIATVENIQHVLQNTTITVRYGNESGSENLKS